MAIPLLIFGPRKIARLLGSASTKTGIRDFWIDYQSLCKFSKSADYTFTLIAMLMDVDKVSLVITGIKPADSVLFERIRDYRAVVVCNKPTSELIALAKRLKRKRKLSTNEELVAILQAVKLEDVKQKYIDDIGKIIVIDPEAT